MLTGGYAIPTRIDVRWGDYSLIACEMALFQYAYEHGPYEYYHLISGVDFPIKPMVEIRRFFEQNRGKEFVGFNDVFYMARVDRYHFFTRYLKPKGIVARAFWKVSRPIMSSITNSNIAKRSLENIEWRRGSEWASLTNDACSYLLSKKAYIKKGYKHTTCCDEVYKQTLLWNSPFRSKIYNYEDEYEGCMREIDWNRGEPYVWGQSPEDFEILMNSNKLFARKFDENISKDLIIKLIGNLKK